MTESTNASVQKEKVSEEQVLFPEVKIGNTTVRPWSFGILFQISTMLDGVLDKVEEKKINIDVEDGFLPYTTIAKLFTIASPEILKIISITLDLSEEEVSKFSMEDGLRIAFTIYQQNVRTIKNVSRLLLQPE